MNDRDNYNCFATCTQISMTSRKLRWSLAWRHQLLCRSVASLIFVVDRRLVCQRRPAGELIVNVSLQIVWNVCAEFVYRYWDLTE